MPTYGLYLSTLVHEFIGIYVRKLRIFNKGLGIDTKNIMLVFDRYFQENSQNIGYGIGLAVVKEFCDKNGIGINIESFEDGNKINLNLKSILN